MVVPPEARDRPPFVSGPVPADEIERLLRIVEERVRLLGTMRDVPSPPVLEPDVLDPAATFEGASLRDLAAPLFHIEKGSVVVRALKKVANVPLGVRGRPQAYFNETIRRVVAAWADVLAATLDNLGALQRDAAAQRARLAELEARLERLERGDRT